MFNRLESTIDECVRHVEELGKIRTWNNDEKYKIIPFIDGEAIKLSILVKLDGGGCTLVFANSRPYIKYLYDQFGGDSSFEICDERFKKIEREEIK